MNILGTDEMGQQVKALTKKANNMRLIPGTQMLQENCQSYILTGVITKLYSDLCVSASTWFPLCSVTPLSLHRVSFLYFISFSLHGFFCISYLSVSMIKHCNQKQLMKEFNLFYGSRGFESIMAGKAWQQVCTHM